MPPSFLFAPRSHSPARVQCGGPALCCQRKRCNAQPPAPPPYLPCPPYLPLPPTVPTCMRCLLTPSLCAPRPRLSLHANLDTPQCPLSLLAPLAPPLAPSCNSSNHLCPCPGPLEHAALQQVASICCLPRPHRPPTPAQCPPAGSAPLPAAPSRCRAPEPRVFVLRKPLCPWTHPAPFHFIASYL